MKKVTLILIGLLVFSLGFSHTSYSGINKTKRVANITDPDSSSIGKILAIAMVNWDKLFWKTELAIIHMKPTRIPAVHNLLNKAQIKPKEKKAKKLKPSFTASGSESSLSYIWNVATVFFL